jgi:UDP-N-acetylglucosamine--N-acetylmuramyl-(pentapeptide) pyrophosphoryl-undecaprenol N-acetylglucosamine transferase
MFPALALAEELRRRGQSIVVACDQRGARYVGADTAHHLIRAASPSGSPGRKMRALGELAVGLGQSVALLRRLRPAAVAALGGYASAPVGLGARLMRIPLLVHEQNAVLGRANRLLARRAAKLALSFPTTRGAEAVRSDRLLVTGNPIRAEVAALRARPYRQPTVEGPLEVLVVGGSQGARAFSEVLPAAIALLPKADRARLRLTQQCRPEDLERVASAYAGLGFAAELASFFDDLPRRLAETQLVISRSGASSVAEILALGRPALFVPFRFAADDHQRVNAEAAAAAGAAWMINEADLTHEALAGKLAICLSEPERLTEMARRASELGRPEATSALADALESLIARTPAKAYREALA